MSSITTTQLEVPFHDVDSLGVVWHGHYSKYYEIASMKLLRAYNLDMATISELGYTIYVMEIHHRFMQPLRYGDIFQVDSRLKETNTCIVIAHTIFKIPSEPHSERKRCARGRTTLVTTDKNGALLLKTPEPILSKLQLGIP